MRTSEDRASLSEIRAELANLQEQAEELCQETRRLINEKRESAQKRVRQSNPFKPIVIDAVALASGHFEAVAIDDREQAPMVADQPRALEFSGGIGDPGAPHAKHR